MSEQQNVETIKSLYAAFGRGDIAFILDQLAPGVKWISNLDPVIPWSGDFTGHPQDFFKAIADSVDVLGFEPGEFVVYGDTVVSMGTFASRAKSTGKSSNAKWIFVWKLSGGKVVSYEQFSDATMAAMFR
ncbi:MAG TPA: nuclear transport factor 2 family protein [Fimbriimonadaceae bacterium]|nr:nuclear transport factor 2 family protein [Fimbriimonadaceae bacterium]